MQRTKNVVLLTMIITQVTNLLHLILSRCRRECGGLYVMGKRPPLHEGFWAEQGSGHRVLINFYTVTVTVCSINELVNSHPAFYYSYAHPVNPELWNKGKISSSVTVKDLFWRSALSWHWCVTFTLTCQQFSKAVVLLEPLEASPLLPLSLAC